MTEQEEKDRALAETLARHFPAALVEGSIVRTGFGELSIDCRVNDLKEWGTQRVASLFFWLSGGRLGPTPIFASISGYASSEHDAVVAGGCNWACSFGPLLRAGLADEEVAELNRIELEIEGRRFSLFVDGLDRHVIFAGNGEPEPYPQARKRFGGGPWLAPLVVNSETLPLLTGPASLLSIFISDGGAQRVVEVKVNGRDWRPATIPLLEAPPYAGAGGLVLLRELALLVAHDAPRALSRRLLERTFAGLAGDGEQWRGHRAHGGKLGAPLTPGQVEALEERVGIASGSRVYCAAQGRLCNGTADAVHLLLHSRRR